MSALAIPRPAPTRAVAPAPAPATRRGHLQLVGPNYVPEIPLGQAQYSLAMSPPRQAAVRLTARGRMVRSLLSLVLGTALAVGTGSWLGSLGGEEYAGPVERVSVTAGDTLWAIAAASAGTGEDVRDVVDDIVQINGLGDAGLAVGQQLLVPAG